MGEHTIISISPYISEVNLAIESVKAERASYWASRFEKSLMRVIAGNA